MLGTWVVLRRLPFYTHAIGTATFPGLVVAGPWGVPAQLDRAHLRDRVGGVLERVQRTRRIDPDAAIGLLLVAALAIGVILASDVYHSGAGVDRLLFGSLIALKPRDLWLTAAAAVGVLLCDRALHRSWLATGFDADGARAGGVRTAAADRMLLLAVAVAVVVALDAVGALLVTVVLIVPAATVRLFEPPLRTQRWATFALAAVEGLAASGSRTPQRRSRPGAGRRRRPRLRPRGTRSPHKGSGPYVGLVEGQARRHHSDLRGGYVRGVDVLGGVSSRSRRGDRRGAGAQRRRQDDAVPGVARRAAVPDGQVELAGRPAYVPQTEGARLDFPVSAHDVALMGAYGRTPWFRRVARADRARADEALARVGLAEQAGDALRHALAAASASAS